MKIIAGMSYTAAEKFLEPFLRDMLQIFKDENIDFSKIDVDGFVSGIPLSRTTMSDRVKDMANDIQDQVLNEVRNSPIGHAIQMDSSTDIENNEQLIAFVRYY